MEKRTGQKKPETHIQKSGCFSKRFSINFVHIEVKQPKLKKLMYYENFKDAKKIKSIFSLSPVL